MYILCTHEMPTVFAERMPFENKSTYDTPLYQSSISIFEAAISSDDPLLIDSNTIKFIGFMPYANTQVSNKSEHKVLRGTSFNPGVYVGGVQNYKVDSNWKHKAIYLFDGEMLKSGNVKIYSSGGIQFSKPGVPKLISDGRWRYLPCDFVNPLRRGHENKKSFHMCLLHRGPQRINPEYNLSLGCVTVDPKMFDQMMKFFSMNEMLMYVHKIDYLANDPDNPTLRHIDGLDFATISSMRNVIYASIKAIVKEDK